MHSISACSRNRRGKMTLRLMMTLVLVAGTLAAQGPPAPVRSPEVRPDGTVTFRLRAPKAEQVELVGEVLQGKRSQAMTKGDDGVWSVTIGPLPPEIWIYNFRVHGVDLPDPSNISLMPRAAGAAAVSSFVEVPGPGVRLLRRASGAAWGRPDGAVRIEGDGGGSVFLGLHASRLRGVRRKVSGLLPAARERRDPERLGRERPGKPDPGQSHRGWERPSR